MPEFRDIITDIKKKNFASIYILMGEEPYYLDKISEALENSVVGEEDKEFDQTILFGADATAGMVMEAAARFPMFSDKRFVALRESQSMYNAKNALDKLKSYVENPNPNCVLAIVYKGGKLNATGELLKAAKKSKDVVVFDSPKIKDYKIPTHIKDYCTALKIQIEERAVAMLAANVGNSLTNLFSEIDKLRVSLPKHEPRITAEMVMDQIGLSREFNNYELVKAVAQRDYFNSINIVRQFEVNPKANPTVMTTAILFSFFQRLVVASFSADKTEKGLMDALLLKNAYALKEIRLGLSNYNASQAVKAIHAIRQFDTKSKGIGSMQKEYALLLELVFTLITL